ncbi:MAG: TIGR02206 family membrane protein [Leptospiraceae bacterium]|nr:TIGR02206 family membrane protein [Leptospiraceae bacterium]
MDERFQHWSPMHLGILILTIVSIGIFIFLGRMYDGKQIQKSLGYFLGLTLVINYIIYVIYRIHSGYWELRYDLPMEFCNWSMIVTALALFTQNRLFAELSYFWVMAGSINGVITPDLQVSFPHIYFFIFFISHSGLVLGSLYIVFGLKLYPRKWAVLRAVFYGQIYFFSAFIINSILRGNYGYTMHKPNATSPMDYFGPWPYYLIVLQILGVIVFSILYIPFYFMNQKDDAKFSFK